MQQIKNGCSVDAKLQQEQQTSLEVRVSYHNVQRSSREQASLSDNNIGEGSVTQMSDELQSQITEIVHSNTTQCPVVGDNEVTITKEDDTAPSALKGDSTILNGHTSSQDIRNHHVDMNGDSDSLHEQTTKLCAQSQTFNIEEEGVSKLPLPATTDQQTTEKSKILEQLNSIRQQRQNLKQNISSTLNQYINEWNLRLLSTQQSYIHALSTLESISAKRIWTEEEYQLSNKWHVMGDIFLIWHRGPFGTISNFRLGKSAITVAGLVKKSADAGNGSTRQQGRFTWGSSTDNKNASPPKATSNTSNNNNKNANASPEKVTVPWNEINSALGQIVFLLYTLQNMPYSGISFQKHILQPCGSASKIGILKKQQQASSSVDGKPKNERRRITALAAYYNNNNNTSSTTANATPGSNSSQSSSPSTSTQSSTPTTPLPGDVTWYNLHHYEENGSMLSMGYYARRNFNTAIEGLLYCIAEACYVVEKHDMSLAAPYIMRVDGLVVGKDVHGNVHGGNSNLPVTIKDGEVSVGGLTLLYDPTNGDQWTMACKYLLTNLKWLIAYTAKHIDR